MLKSFSRTSVFTARTFTGKYGLRSFSNSHIKMADSVNSEPPVKLYGLDGTYASALYTAAVKSKSLSSVDKSLSTLENLINKDEKLIGILSDPALSTEDKETAVEILSKSISADNTTKNLLKVLADNNRLGLINQIIEKFSTLIRAEKGEVSANVISSQPLDSKTFSRIESAISKSSFLKRGQKLVLSNTVAPEILGGLIVSVGDRTVDLSISNRIAKLNKLLTDSI